MQRLREGKPRIGWAVGGISAGVGLNACISSALATIMPVLLIDILKASYLETSLFMIGGTLASTVAVHLLGRASDRPRRRYPIAIASALCGVAGAAALCFATGFWTYLLVFVSLIAVAGSLFPQLMALAFLYDRASTSVMRAIASGGWVVGPPLAGLILSAGKPRAVFLAIALAYAALLVLIRAMAPLFRPAAGGTAAARISAGGPAKTRSLFSVVAVLAAAHFLISLCTLAMPWRILQLDGTALHVGVAFSIAAAVEIPTIALAGKIVGRLGYGNLLLGCSLAVALCFLLGAVTDRIDGIYVVGLLNGMATGVMMGASLLLLQEMIPDRPGHASAVYSNMLRLTYVAALLTAGLIAQRFSVPAVFWTAGATACVLATALLFVQPLAGHDRGGGAPGAKEREGSRGRPETAP